MEKAFLVQMRQSNKCVSVRNDEIINLHLGSGAGLGKAGAQPAPNNNNGVALFNKRFERSVYCNEHKTNSENKNTTNSIANFIGVNRLFVLIYPNQNNSVKRFNG